MSDVSTAAPEAPAAAPSPVQPPPVAAPVVAVAPPAPVPPAAPAPVAAAAQPVAPVAPPVVGPHQDVEPEDGHEPRWLAKKLEKTRMAVLRQIGADTEGDAKAAIEAHKARIEAEKSELQRAQEKAAKADILEREKSELLGTVKTYATAQLAGLTPEQRAAVESIAGDNPTNQLKTLEALRPTWAATQAAAEAEYQARLAAHLAATAAQTAAVAAAAPVAPAAPAPLAAPANTAPSASAPTSNAPPEKTPFEIYTELRNANPFHAARYRAVHEKAIAAAEKQVPRV